MVAYADPLNLKTRPAAATNVSIHDKIGIRKMILSVDEETLNGLEITHDPTIC